MIKVPHQRGLDKLFHKSCPVESLGNTNSRRGFGKLLGCQGRGLDEESVMTKLHSEHWNTHLREYRYKVECVLFSTGCDRRQKSDHVRKCRKSKKCLLNIHGKSAQIPAWTQFLLEHSNCNISCALFCHIRPFWVVTPTNADRKTCLRKVHEKMPFLFKKLHLPKVVGSNSLESIVESTCCSTDSKGFQEKRKKGDLSKP